MEKKNRLVPQHPQNCEGCRLGRVNKKKGREKVEGGPKELRVLLSIGVGTARSLGGERP